MLALISSLCSFSPSLVFSPRRSTARWLSQWRPSPALGKVCAYACVWEIATCWLHYMLDLKNMQLLICPVYPVSFCRSAHAHMRLCVHACVCEVHCCSPPWPKVNGWRISLVFSVSIVWGSSGSVLDVGGSSVLDALNPSETPRYNISIVYLFSLFHPTSQLGEKEIQRSSRLVCTRINWRQSLSFVFTVKNH